MTNAKFIVFEGIDGAGKTTQIQLLASALEERGIKCNGSAEPTKLPIGSSSGVYSSSFKITPKRSRRGVVICPARVVAPIRVKRGRSMRMLLADGPFPMMISSA